MTAIERMMAAQFKIETVLGKMMSVGFMAFSSAQDRDARMKIMRERILKYQELFNAAQDTFQKAAAGVRLAVLLHGEDVELPEPWESVQDASEEEALAVLEEMWRQANEEEMAKEENA